MGKSFTAVYTLHHGEVRLQAVRVAAPPGKGPGKALVKKGENEISNVVERHEDVWVIRMGAPVLLLAVEKLEIRLV